MRFRIAAGTRGANPHATKAMHQPPGARGVLRARQLSDHNQPRHARDTRAEMKDVMCMTSDVTCRDLLSSSAERVRAGLVTVELEEAPVDDRNGT